MGFTGEMREPIDKAYYICQTYNRLGKNACTSHKIEARDLYNLVLKDIQDLAAMVRQSDEQESDVKTFIGEIRKYATIQELDEAVLNRLISRIVVGEVQKKDGQKYQEVRIIYNFVGEIPDMTE